MKNLALTRSSFSTVYVRLLVILAIVLVGFYLLTRFYVAPRLILDRSESVLSLLRSHSDDIILNKTRSVRDELLKARIIDDDKNFHHYFFDEKEKVAQLLKGCKQLTSSICLGENKSIFLEGTGADTPANSFKYAVELDTSINKTPAALFLLEAVVMIFLGLAFLALYKSIRENQIFLENQLKIALRSFEEIKGIFKASKAENEFEFIQRSTDELIQEFRSAKSEIKKYKEDFERHTKLNQLALTIGQVSHDLKAPFNEAENFLESLPLLLSRYPISEILDSITSLRERMQTGKKSLEEALRFTKDVSIEKDRIGIIDLMRSISQRASQNSKLKNLKIEFSSNEDFSLIGDKLRLETALLNILENAAEEKQDATVQFEVEQSEKNSARITILDNGNGIHVENLEEIFHPLASFKMNGTGLGLSSTREILSMHGGRIKALPNIGGAKFEIILPTEGSSHA